MVDKECMVTGASSNPFLIKRFVFKTLWWLCLLLVHFFFHSVDGLFYGVAAVLEDEVGYVLVYPF